MPQQIPRDGRRACLSIFACLLLAACGPSGPSDPSSATARLELSAQPTAEPTPTAYPVESMPTSAYQVTIVEGAPNVLAMSEDRVWVELHRSNSIAALDPVAMSSTTYPAISAHCAIASDGADTIWVTNAHQNLLTRVDATTGESTRSLSLPEACGIAANAGQVWVTLPGDGVVARLDPTTGETLLEVATPGLPFVVSRIGDLVYASGEGGGGWLMAIDPDDGHVVATRRAPEIRITDSLALGFDSLWATSRLDSRLYRLDPETLETIATVEIGREPSGVALFGGSVWVSRLNGGFFRVDPSANAVTGTWSLRLTWLAWPTVGFDRIWMTSLEENVVLAVDPAAL
jgi:streptogramin lyase